MNHANGIESPYIDEDLLKSRLNCFQISQTDEMEHENSPPINGNREISFSECFTTNFEDNIDNRKKLSSQIAKDIENRLKRKTGGAVYGRSRKTWEGASSNNKLRSINQEDINSKFGSKRAKKLTII